MRRVSVTLALAAIGCSSFGAMETSTRDAGIAEAGDGGLLSDADAEVESGADPSPEGGIGPANRCGALYRETFEKASFDAGTSNELTLVSNDGSGTFSLESDSSRGNSRVARFTAKAGGHSPHLSLGVERPCRTRVHFWMSANGALTGDNVLRVFDAAIRRPEGKDNGLALLVTSQGVRLDGAGAYQMIPASTNGWHEVTIILEVDGRFSLQFDAERVDEGTADSRTIRTPLIGFDIGIMVSEANGASDFSIDDLEID